MAGRKENLKSPRSTEEARERGRKGGVASGQVRREKASLREAVKAALDVVMKGEDGKDVSAREAIVAAQMLKALNGDSKAFEVIRDTAGEKPVQKMENEVSGGMALHHEVTPVVAGLLDRLVKEKEGQA